MAAVTKERPGRYKKVNDADLPLAAGVKAFKGASLGWDTRTGATKGFIVPFVAAAGIVFLGRAGRTVDNTAGANGAKNVPVKFHRELTVFVWDNDTTTPIVAANRGSKAYFQDDQTVTSTATTRSEAGTIFRIADDGQIEVVVS